MDTMMMVLVNGYKGYKRVRDTHTHAEENVDDNGKWFGGENSFWSNVI